jgi:hypothetical protein
MRPKIIYLVPIFMNLTWRIEFGIKERYNLLPANRLAILEQPIPFHSSALQ